jgi:hypothetical protein
MHLASLILLDQHHASLHSLHSNMNRLVQKKGLKGSGSGDEEDLSPFQKVQQWVCDHHADITAMSGLTISPVRRNTRY